MKTITYCYILLFWTISCTSDGTNEFSEKLPNFLWITCEDLSPILGIYGDQVAITPNIDRLAVKGIQYNNAFATAPVCSPARSSLVSGVYASTLGTHDHRSDFKIPPEIRTLPHLLRAYGYFCSNNYKQDYNFTDTTIWDETGRKAHWRNRPSDKPFFSIFNFETTHQSRIFGNDSTFYERFGKFLSESERHHPDSIQLPPYYFDSPEVRKLWARYYDITTIMDRQVKEVLDQLEEDGLSDNTIVFYFSDHGTGMPRSKGCLYVSGLKVPFIVYVPEKYQHITNLKPGTKTDDLVSFIDFQPTLLSIINKTAPDYMQGKPFLGSYKTSSRKYIYAIRDRTDEVFDISRTVKSAEFSYIRNFLPHLPLIQHSFYGDQSEIKKELYRLFKIGKMTPEQQSMWLPRRKPEELYDLKNDPYETKNLASDPVYKEILLEMRQRMKDWMIGTNDAGLMPEGYIIDNLDSRTVYEISISREIYPIEKIIKLNDLILEQPIDQEALLEKLKNDHELIRYWSAIIIQYISNPSDQIMQGLSDALQDKSWYVRIAAADALCSFNHCNEQAQEVILEGLRSEKMIDKLLAARTFQLHKYEADQIENEVREIHSYLKTITNENQWKGYDINTVWALNEAFKDMK
jgi:arylsulfatase A-like enzyme